MAFEAYDLKKLQIINAMSEETQCFSADLWVDGVKFAHVSNDGRGGCDRFMPYPPHTRADEDALASRLMSENPDNPRFARKGDAIESLTMVLIVRADLVKKMRSAVIFIDGTQTMSLKTKDKSAPGEPHFAHIRQSHPDAVILNEMDPGSAAMASVAAEFAAMDAESSRPFTP